MPRQRQPKWPNWTPMLVPRPPTELEETRAQLAAALTDLAQARTELAAYKEKTCDTCKHCDETFPEHCLQWDHWNCDSDFSCAAHERRAQSAEDEKGETG